MDELTQKLEALRVKVNQPLPMDPWTYGRIATVLEALVKKWREKGYEGEIVFYTCASDLEDVLMEWKYESDKTAEQMYQEHLRAGHAADDHVVEEEEEPESSLKALGW